MGAIQSLGARRDLESVSLLIDWLRASNPEIAAASAFALGEIGSVKAAKALKDFLGGCPAALRLTVADAALVCAEHLLADGRKSDAKSLYQVLARPAQATHIQQAAARGLQKCVSASSHNAGT